MNKKKSIIKILALLLIGIWLFRPLVFKSLDINFVSLEIENFYKQIWLILLPFALIVLTVKSWKTKLLKLKYVLGLFIGGSLLILIIFFLNFVNSFCQWELSDVLYSNRTNDYVIREKTYDCGALDSSPSYQFVKTKPIGSYLIYCSEIEIDQLDESIWLKK